MHSLFGSLLTTWFYTKLIRNFKILYVDASLVRLKDFNGLDSLFEVNPIGFRVKSTKRLGTPRNTLVLLYKESELAL